MTEEDKGPRLSPSRLQTFASCSHAYYLEKIVGAPQRQAVWFIQGTAVHAGIEAYEKSHRTLSVDGALDHFYMAWGRELRLAQEEQPDEDMWMVGGRRKLATDIDKRHEMGEQQVADYILQHPADGPLRPAEIIPGEPAVEVGFQLDFDGFRVIGYIDCVFEDQNGLWFPVDWKTGSKLPVDPYQLATYGVALEELTGEKVPWGAYWDCRNNELVTKELTNYPREVVGEWYRRFHEGRKNDIYLPNPGESCFTCTVRPACQFAA
ncbi:PD-(D/E)XK nuclease family protein [Actinomadura sp. NPDC048021]|uniref:RecB family exonuclease n=1 Tax=Actinomadura sp. NPDC048021 TaxID=3155385 RepID=UPI0033E4A8E5